MGLRTLVGILTIFFLVYVGLYFQTIASRNLAYALFALAGLRAVLLIYDIVRRRRSDRQLRQELEQEERERAAERPGAGDVGADVEQGAGAVPEARDEPARGDEQPERWKKEEGGRSGYS